MKRLAYILTTLCCAINIMAQQPADVQDKVTETVADVKRPKLFQDISVGVDLFGAGYRFIADEGDFQAYVQANIKGTFLPVVELGYGTADKYYEDTYTTYKSKGMFGRIGCDYNLLKQKLDNYKLTVGLRYGMSHFNYDTTMPTDTLHTTYDTVSESCTTHWVELALGVKVKVSGPFFMGWSVRYRRRIGCTDYTNPPLYAPGYGNASNSSSFMALYTIGLMF